MDDSQQGAVRAQAHAKHTVLTNDDTHIMLKRIFTSFHNLSLILHQAHRGGQPYLFVSLSGKESKTGNPEETSFLILTQTEYVMCYILHKYIFFLHKHVCACVTSCHADIVLIAGDLLVVW